MFSDVYLFKHTDVEHDFPFTCSGATSGTGTAYPLGARDYPFDIFKRAWPIMFITIVSKVSDLCRL